MYKDVYFPSTAIVQRNTDHTATASSNLPDPSTYVQNASVGNLTLQIPFYYIVNNYRQVAVTLPAILFWQIDGLIEHCQHNIRHFSLQGQLSCRLSLVTDHAQSNSHISLTMEGNMLSNCREWRGNCEQMVCEQSSQ